MSYSRPPEHLLIHCWQLTSQKCGRQGWNESSCLNIRKSFIYVVLTHLPLVLHTCVSKWGQHWASRWLVALSAPSHYLSRYWIIVNWTLRNKLQWNFKQNSKVYFIIKCVWKCRLWNDGHVCSKGDRLNHCQWSSFIPGSMSNREVRLFVVLTVRQSTSHLTIH